jgi:antitoxin CptB
MTTVDRARECIRWRCRRGLLELDLLLNAFIAKHLDGLDAAALDVFGHLLTRADPELLDLVMGRQETPNAREREILALIRAGSCNAMQH